MATRDIYQMSHELDDTTTQSIIDRLEFRGTDATFNRMRDLYFDKISLPPKTHVLELGCGTGVLARALVQREGFLTEYVLSGAQSNQRLFGVQVMARQYRQCIDLFVINDLSFIAAGVIKTVAAGCM